MKLNSNKANKKLKWKTRWTMNNSIIQAAIWYNCYLHKIDINMTTDSVKSVLGDPLFIESAIDDDIVITKYIYSFRTKEYNKEELENNGNNQSGLVHGWGRNTNIQFVFNDDLLVAWEEDKLTLSMAVKQPASNGSAFQMFNFLLNVVVITLNAAVLMSL